MELPSLSRKDREQAVINRLRGWYPGKLDDKYVVVLPNGRRGSHLVFVFDESLKNNPLSVSTLAAVKLCKRGRHNCVIAWGGWVEYVILEEGSVLSSMVTGKEEKLPEQLATHAAEWFRLEKSVQADNAEPAEQETEQHVKVFCAVADCPAESPIAAGGFIFSFIALEKALLPVPRSGFTCFPERLPQVKRRRLLYAAVACVTAVVFLFFMRDWYVKREALNAARREEAKRIALELAERKAREEHLAALQSAWEEQLNIRHIGVYATIETLASCLSPAIRLYSATVKEDGSFRLEGNAADAIAAMEDLQSHPATRSAAIGTIIWDGGFERFTVNGTVEKLSLLPEEDLTEEEKISWYEAALVHSVRNDIMPNTAAAAAQQVRDLLERHHVRITRFRYLDVQGGWAIECAASGAGIQIVRVLKEADEGNSMRVTAIETQNRLNGIDAVITFFIPGPGEERSRRDYEPHPSIAQIASLYGSVPSRSSGAPGPVRQVAETGFTVLPPPQVSYIPGSLEYVGFVGSAEGKRFIYVKDTKSGELYRLTEGEGSFSYKINSTGFISAILDGSSAPVEVRRNDGF